MKKQAKRGVLIAFLFIIFLAMIVNVSADDCNLNCPKNLKIKSDGTVTADDCSSSQLSNILSKSGNTYSLKQDLKGCKHDGIEIKRENAILDCEGHYIESDFDGSDNGIEIYHHGVTVKNCIIKNFPKAGISIAGSEYVSIEGSKIYVNEIHGNERGIEINYGGGGNIYSNLIRSNKKQGIYMVNSEYFYTYYNVIRDNWEEGIQLAGWDSEINNNYFNNNGGADIRAAKNYPGNLENTCQSVRIGGTVYNTPSAWCDLYPYEELNNPHNCIIRGVCSSKDPDKKLKNFEPEESGIYLPLCSAIAYISLNTNHPCSDREESFSFCVSGESNKVYDCLGCGGFHYATCPSGSWCKTLHYPFRGICCTPSYSNYPSCGNVEDCCYPSDLTCQEGKCCIPDGAACTDDNQCCPGKVCSFNNICEDAPPCEIEYAKLDAQCTDCNYEDIIKLRGDFTGDCSEVDTLVVNVYGTDGIDECDMNLYVPCFPGASSGTVTCQDNYEINYIPPECEGMWVEAQNAKAYNSGTQGLIVETDEIEDYGGFGFFDNLPNLESIGLSPPYLEKPPGELIEFTTTAYYENGPTKDVSTSDLTSYGMEFLNGVLEHTGSPPDHHNEFTTRVKGTEQVNVKFPYDLWNPQWPFKEDNSIINVFNLNPQCVISDASVTANCGEDGCLPEDTIDTEIKIRKGCFNAGLKYINVSFSNFADLFGFEVEVDETTDCVEEGYVHYICTVTYEIKEQDLQGREGEEFFAYQVLLKDQDKESLNSKTNLIYPGFGAFKFWQEPPPNQAPVAVIVKPVGQGEVPVDGIPGYLPGAEVPFRDESYDEDGIIITWDWHYRFGLGEWILLNHFNQQNYEQEFTKSFDLPGTYQVKLLVEDDENAVDEDMKNFVITDGEAPIIIPDSPDSNVIQSREVLFNVSESYDPPIEYKEMKERLGDFYWEFNDGSVPGTFRDNWTYASNFTHILTNAQELYEFNLTLYDKNSPPNSAYYQFIFKTWRCYDGNEILFADGSKSESCFSSKPLYCASDGNQQTGEGRTISKASICGCTPPKVPHGDICVAHDPLLCNGLIEGNCLSVPGCWWDECTSCITNPPASCSSYKGEEKGQEFCEADKCVVGYEPTSQGDCGSWVTIEGKTYYIDCKGCAWDNEECIQDYELKEQNGQGSQQCHESRTYGDCVGGYMNVEITTECCSIQDLGSPTGNCDPMPTSCSFGTGLHLVSCDTTTETQVCGIITRALPGFGWLNFIIVIFLISVYYVIYVIFILKKR